MACILFPCCRSVLSSKRLVEWCVYCSLVIGVYCGVTGWLNGVHTGPWLGEEATNKSVSIRFGFHYRVDAVNKNLPEGKIFFFLHCLPNIHYLLF